MLKLDFNERSDQPSPPQQQLAEQGLDLPLWRYPARENLENQLAEFYGLSANQVLVTNGGDEAIYVLMRILSEGKKLILPLPAFSQYTWGIESWNLSPELLPANPDQTIDRPAITQALQKTANGILVLTSPNNPTGEVIAVSQIKEWLRLAKANNNLIFLDEAYVEFSELQAEATIELLKTYDNLILLRTFSKAYGLAGIRCGYLLGNACWIDEFRCRCMPFNVNAISLELAATALKESSQQDKQSYVEKIRLNRNQLLEKLRGWRVSVNDSEGNFVLLRLTQEKAKLVYQFLKRNDILVRNFGGALANCIRITIPLDLDPLTKLLQQVFDPDLICLDMDGVLIDTSRSYDRAVIETVKAFTDELIFESAIIEMRNRGGFNNDWVLSQALIAEKGIEVDLATVTDKFQTFYLGRNYQQQNFDDGLIHYETALIDQQMIERIKTTKRTFAVVTGRPRLEASIGLNNLDLNNIPFIGLDDVANGKPDPEGIRKLQKEYGHLSWMVGDNPDDIEAAKASGSVAIGVNKPGQDNAKVLYQAGADLVIDNINQLESLLCL